MWKRELIRNKIYAVLMVLASLPVVILERDGTVLLLSLFFGVPMFFAKENSRKGVYSFTNASFLFSMSGR